MKVRKIHLWLFVLLLTVVAVVPGVGAQGDFMTLSLGDNRQVVCEKLAALESARQIEITSPATFKANFLEKKVDCSVKFFQGKLYQVLIRFDGVSPADYAKTLKDQVEGSINLALKEKNGEPSVFYDYPDIDEVGEVLQLTAEWEFDGKTILSGVMSDETSYHAKVEIYDNRLVAGR